MWQSWGDLPDSHRRLRSHIPLCCSYTKISIELAVQAGLEPATVALTARRSAELSYWTSESGTGPWIRTTRLSLIRGVLSPLS